MTRYTLLTKNVVCFIIIKGISRIEGMIGKSHATSPFIGAEHRLPNLDFCKRTKRLTRDIWGEEVNLRVLF